MYSITSLDTNVYNDLGVTYFYIGKYKTALNYFNLALMQSNVKFNGIKALPEEYIYSNIAITISKLGENQEALNVINKAKELSQKNNNLEAYKNAIIVTNIITAKF